MRTMRRRLRHHVLALLRSAMPSPPNLSRAIAVACGGNAEALVRLAPGRFVGRTPTINVRLLKDQTWRLLALDVPGRMRVFRVRKDRAEVMGIAAIIITTLAKWLGIAVDAGAGSGRARRNSARSGRGSSIRRSMSSEEEKDARRAARRSAMVWAAFQITTSSTPSRWRGSRFRFSTSLRPLHQMGADLRLVAGNGRALLHDVGDFVNRKSHHRHGEYLIRNGEIPGLRGWRCDMVAALVRYHNTKSEPELEHPSYAALDGQRRRAGAASDARCCASRKNSSPSTRSASRRGRPNRGPQARFSCSRGGWYAAGCRWAWNEKRSYSRRNFI